ncbi:MAG: polymer-forming cytoskeletal protein [Hyphomicrobiales bacterium]
MFWSNNNNNNEGGNLKKKNMKVTNFEGSERNLIGNGTKIIGEVHSSGDFRIDGELEGKINCEGKIVVGQTGMINGEIDCNQIDISGSVIGQLKVKDIATLTSSADFKGEVKAGNLAIEPGAKFSGTSEMTQSSKLIGETGA